MLFKSTLFFSVLIFAGMACPLNAAEVQSLSTSNLIPVDWINKESEDRIELCSEEKAVFSRSYVSLEITKLRVAKSDGWVKRLFNGNRRAFPVATLTGRNLNQPIAVSKVGTAKVLLKELSQVDLAVTWQILERVPWTIEGAELNLRIGYSADSNIDAIVKAFSEITASIPDYTIQTSVAVGLAIASNVDQLLFGSERTTDLLNSRRDLPLSGGTLCEGYYAIFGADDATVYNKYENGDLAWNERSQDLQFNGTEPSDVSYAVVRVAVQDRYYSDKSDALNDNRKVWSQKYREAQSELAQLVWVSSEEEVESITKRVRDKIFEGRAFLDADLTLVQDERREIHTYVVEDVQPKLNAVRKRIAGDGEITAASTKESIAALLNATSGGVTMIDLPQREVSISNPDIIDNVHKSIRDPEELAKSIERSLDSIVF